MASSPSIAATNSNGNNAWPALLVSLVETALSAYLALDPDSDKLIAPLHAKTIALQIKPFDWTLYLCPADGTIQVLQEWLGSVDVTFSGSPAAYARLRLSDDPRSELHSGGVSISGDMEVARHFQRLFERLDIDWEEQLSQYTGDMLAQRLGDWFRTGRDWLQTTHQTLRWNCAEYFQEETRDLPNALETEAFYAAVDALRTDVDRLEARVCRLREF